MLTASDLSELRSIARASLTDKAEVYPRVRVERPGGSHSAGYSAEPAASYPCRLVGLTQDRVVAGREIPEGALQLSVPHDVEITTGSKVRVTGSDWVRWVEVQGTDGPATAKVLRRYVVTPTEGPDDGDDKS